MARRNDHSREEIHQMALDAAERIVVAEGYKGLSARKLAAAIDYTVGTLYLVFENLDDVVRQVNERTLDNLHAWLQQRSDPAAPPEEAVLALARAYIAYAETQAPRWNMLFEYIAAQGSALPQSHLEKVGKVFGLVEAALAPLADRAGSSEVEQAARVLWASVHGICLLKISQRMELAGGQDAEAMSRTLIENFLRGFRAARHAG